MRPGPGVSVHGIRADERAGGRRETPVGVSDRLTAGDDTMPTKEEKDPKEAHVRRLMDEQKLVIERLLLLRKPGAETQAAPEEETKKGDLFDRAEASLRKELESATKEQLLARAGRLERAYRKLIAGSYGICEGCGGEIPRRRLEAMPEALYCTPCQEKKETTGRIIRATG